ncbi:unnamed protein product [Amoebophrya sp. A120]|nr:unnamed protein product [Amoebophrya sp. A120]|eukprot:GSA120T00017688001.1
MLHASDGGSEQSGSVWTRAGCKNSYKKTTDVGTKHSHACFHDCRKWCYLLGQAVWGSSGGVGPCFAVLIGGVLMVTVVLALTLAFTGMAIGYDFEQTTIPSPIIPPSWDEKHKELPEAGTAQLFRSTASPSHKKHRHTEETNGENDQKRSVAFKNYIPAASTARRFSFLEPRFLLSFTHRRNFTVANESNEKTKRGASEGHQPSFVPSQDVVAALDGASTSTALSRSMTDADTATFDGSDDATITSFSDEQREGTRDEDEKLLDRLLNETILNITGPLLSAMSSRRSTMHSSSSGLLGTDLPTSSGGSADAEVDAEQKSGATGPSTRVVGTPGLPVGNFSHAAAPSVFLYNHDDDGTSGNRTSGPSGVDSSATFATAMSRLSSSFRTGATTSSGSNPFLGAANATTDQEKEQRGRSSSLSLLNNSAAIEDGNGIMGNDGERNRTAEEAEEDGRETNAAADQQLQEIDRNEEDHQMSLAEQCQSAVLQVLAHGVFAMHDLEQIVHDPECRATVVQFCKENVFYPGVKYDIYNCLRKSRMYKITPM